MKIATAAVHWLHMFAVFPDTSYDRLSVKV